MIIPLLAGRTPAILGVFAVLAALCYREFARAPPAFFASTW